ncbi:MAG: hypothetical protein RIG62_07865 [Cyclobacteriaceae bacterium]
MARIKFLQHAIISRLPDFRVTPQQEKDTGLIVILICLLVSFFYPPELWMKTALAATLMAIIWPRIYFPLAVVWFSLAKILGFVSTYVILTLLFTFLVIPVGIVRRMGKKDSLKLKDFKKSSTSCFIHRDHIFEPSDLQHLF